MTSIRGHFEDAGINKYSYLCIYIYTCINLLHKHPWGTRNDKETKFNYDRKKNQTISRQFHCSCCIYFERGTAKNFKKPPSTTIAFLASNGCYKQNADFKRRLGAQLLLLARSSDAFAAVTFRGSSHRITRPKWYTWSATAAAYGGMGCSWRAFLKMLST